MRESRAVSVQVTSHNGRRCRVSRPVDEIEVELALLQIHRQKRQHTMTRFEYKRSCANTVELLKELAQAKKEAEHE